MYPYDRENHTWQKQQKQWYLNILVPIRLDNISLACKLFYSKDPTEHYFTVIIFDDNTQSGE